MRSSTTHVVALVLSLCAMLSVAAYGQQPEELPAFAAPASADRDQAGPQMPQPAGNQSSNNAAAHAATEISVPHDLPHDLSPWGMFQAADWVVKAVMIGLALASFMVWTIWLGKSAQLFFARRGLARELKAIAGETSTVSAASSLDYRHSVARGMLDAAQREMQLSTGATRASALERLSTRLNEIESDANRAIRGGMSFLATVAATAPFIGLFGTVWGIMNSFIGISKTQTTNLAVVAPGIAEALLATAIGLVAAIPAVMLYNQLSQNIADFKRLMRETKGEVWRIVSRQADALATDRSTSRLHAAE